MKEEDRPIAAKALCLLARKEQCRALLEKKLKIHNFPLEGIKRSLDRLQDQGLLSDERYARIQIRSLSIRNFSDEYIRQKLDFEGVQIDSEMLTKLFEEEGIPKREKLEKLVEKKKKLGEGPEAEHKWRQKVFRLIASKGHSYEDFSLVSHLLDGDFD